MIESVTGYFRFVRSYIRELWQNTHFDVLQFERVREAALVVAALTGVLVLALVVRKFWQTSFQKWGIVLPALLGKRRGSLLRRVIFTKLTAATLFGIAAYAVALSDPVEPFAKKTETHPGRQMAIIVDYSGSMNSELIKDGKVLMPKGANRYFSAIEAAKYFVQLRVDGQYKDQIGLVAFSDFASTVSPFTNDYENLLMSLGFLSDSTVWKQMPGSGTRITLGIEEGVKLFRLFGRMDGTLGNALILFSDGEDGEKISEDIITEARNHSIPIYFIRTSGGYPTFDSLWASTARETSGAFYAAPNEDYLLSAIKDIDRKVTGTVEENKYTSRMPRYALFVFGALGLLMLVVACIVASRWFRTFP